MLSSLLGRIFFPGGDRRERVRRLLLEALEESVSLPSVLRCELLPIEVFIGVSGMAAGAVGGFC